MAARQGVCIGLMGKAGPMTLAHNDNAAIAAKLQRVAELLELQRANSYRVEAWKHGADVIRKLPEPIAKVAQEEGEEGIRARTGLGHSLASVVRELALTGHLAMLSRLEGAVSVEEGLMRVPGVGPTLASKAHRELGIESLEDFEAAANDGRLAKLPHVGPRRLEMVQRELKSMLARSQRRAADFQPPSIEALLTIDAQYRRLAAQDALPRIAPRRFNPRHERWLPIFHTEAEGFACTVLFSNTARAHQRQATHDWVVIYFEKDGKESQCTVVTEIHGALAARRVVRGRERECAHFYYEHPAPIGAPPEASEHLPMH
jgi:hypothetical protein